MDLNPKIGPYNYLCEPKEMIPITEAYIVLDRAVAYLEMWKEVNISNVHFQKCSNIIIKDVHFQGGQAQWLPKYAHDGTIGDGEIMVGHYTSCKVWQYITTDML